MKKSAYNGNFCFGRSLGPVLGILMLTAGACSSETEKSNASSTGNSVLKSSKDQPILSSSGSVGVEENSVGTNALLTGFTKTEFGGYKLGDEITNNEGVKDTKLEQPIGEEKCNALVGVVRDFQGSGSSNKNHPDFNVFPLGPDGANNTTENLVEELLDPNDRKPVFAGKCTKDEKSSDCPFGQMMTTKSNFDQWYRFDKSNKSYLIYFALSPKDNVFSFSSKSFFPVDGMGWKDSPEKKEDGKPHNFGFTTELHTQFTYKGGERFSFTGDDDLWVFINGRLALDLGGVHSEVSQELDIDARKDALKLTVGKTYPLELFHAERHVSQSNFSIETTLAFVDCGTIPPDVGIIHLTSSVAATGGNAAGGREW